MIDDAFAYFITLRTYGTWLHGVNPSSVNRKSNTVGTPRVAPSRPMFRKMYANRQEPELIFNLEQARTVLRSVQETCGYFGWTLYAAHVRSNHGHLVLQADVSKEEATRKLKSFATRDLRQAHDVLRARKHFWARHGSTRNIWRPGSLFPVLYYVVKEQGEPMVLFYDGRYYSLEDEMLYEVYSV